MPPVRLLLGLAAAAFAAAVAAMPAHGVPPVASPAYASSSDEAWAALDEVAKSATAIGPFEPAVRLARRPDRTLARSASEDWFSPAEPLVVVKYDESSDESSVSQAAAMEEFDDSNDDAREEPSVAFRASVGTEGGAGSEVPYADEEPSLALRASVGSQSESEPVNDVRVSSLRFNPLRGHPSTGVPQGGEWTGRNPLRTRSEPLTNSPENQFPSVASESDRY